jgi:hypothetical protein
MQVKNTYSLEKAVEMAVNTFNGICTFFKSNGYDVQRDEPENRPKSAWYQVIGVLKKLNGYNIYMSFKVSYKSSMRWGTTNLDSNDFYPLAEMDVNGRKTTFTVLNEKKLIEKIKSVLDAEAYKKEIQDEQTKKKDAARTYYCESKKAVEVIEDRSQYYDEYTTRYGIVKSVSGKAIRFSAAVTIEELVAIHELIKNLRSS